MLILRSAFLSLFVSSYNYAADFFSEKDTLNDSSNQSMMVCVTDSFSDESVLDNNQQWVITDMSTRGISGATIDILEKIRSVGGLLSDANEGESILRKTAADEAFWVHYSDLKLQQKALPSLEGHILFPNLLELIRDSSAPIIKRAHLEDEEKMLSIAHFKFYISCDLLFERSEGAESNSPWIENELFSAITEKGSKCRDWFIKVLQSKDGDIPWGRSILIGRLVHLADFLNEIATSDDIEKQDRARNMLENNAITNANNCPDRAISGLDDFDFDIALFHTPTVNQAVHLLLRQYKKRIIQECLVEHQFYESAQEYVYLLVLLNDHFNLGLSSAGILSGEIGARKTFDVAAKILMNTISIEGLCHFIAQNTSFRHFLRGMSAHNTIMDEIACDPETAEDALYTYTLGVVEPYIKATFVIRGEKFSELTAKDIRALEAVLDTKS